MSQGRSTAGKPTKVAIVCRPEVLRLGLRRVLASVADLAVTAWSYPPEGLGRVRVAVLCDRGIADPPAACRRLRDSHSEQVVVVSSRSDVDLMLETLAAGAAAVVAETDAPRELLAAVRAAAEGIDYVAPSPLALLLDWHRAQRRSRGERAQRRDVELLRLLASGRSTGEIAERLGIAPKTVRNRASLLYGRMGVRTRSQAVRVAEERGLLD